MRLPVAAILAFFCWYSCVMPTSDWLVANSRSLRGRSGKEAISKVHGHIGTRKIKRHYNHTEHMYRRRKELLEMVSNASIVPRTRRNFKPDWFEMMQSPPPDCGSDFVGLMQSMVSFEGGSVVIIGANVGATRLDPTWRGLSSPDNRALQKVFVEPIPWLFETLTANVHALGMQNAVLVNAAVTNKTSDFTMFCLRRINPVTGTKLRSLPSFTSELCSLDRERFFSPYGVLMKQFSREEIDAQVVEVRVRGLTVRDLLSKYRISPSDVRSVQIDVEGFDDEVVFQLPFSDESFRPSSLAFEYVLLNITRLEAVLHHLRHYKYTSCVYLQNVYSFRGDNRPNYTSFF
mmetsp:Transcript_24484/g.36003  ORF Transcript_24484/g.36003 Transcript_24484/m.36003 type:complete len:346 (-) Transcript_24484:164-1201(-)